MVKKILRILNSPRLRSHGKYDKQKPVSAQGDYAEGIFPNYPNTPRDIKLRLARPKFRLKPK